MKNFLSLLIVSAFFTNALFADLFFSEYAEGSSNNKYLEIYNPTSADIDLSGYAFANVSNAPTTVGVHEYWNTFTEGAVVAAGGVYVVCHGSSADDISAECDQTYNYMSNGDDGFALATGSSDDPTYIDWVGDFNGDPGSAWDVCGAGDTKDNTLVRVSSVCAGSEWSVSSNADTCEWEVYANNTWDYLGSHTADCGGSADDGGDDCDDDVAGCMDENATNYDACAVNQSYNDFGTSTCTYESCEDIPTAMGCLWSDGTSSEWSNGWSDCTDNGGQVCGLHEVIFELDLPSDLTGTPHVRGTFNNWCDDCLNSMSDNGDGVWTFVQYFGADETHQYKFTIGSGWDVAEDVPDECAVEGTDNRGFATGGGNTSQTLASCYGTCDAECSEPVEPAANLFFSEHAEGSSNNKYFEVYNASDADVSLADYAFVNCSTSGSGEGCTDWEYTNAFADGAIVAAGDVYVVCHSSADESGIIPFCDETRTLYHNGNDSQGLVYTADGTLLDVIGLNDGLNPGGGWEVAGIANATKDHTLVRKSEVTSGTTDWTASAGTNSDDSQWLVFDQNTWDFIGSHPHDFSSAGCTDTDACNYDADASEDDGSCLYNDCLGECGGSAVADDCGVCEGDGSTCAVSVTFQVDMNLEGVVGDVKVRTSTVNGEYNPSDWYVMDDADGDLVYSYTMTLSSGVTYGYNFNNSDGSGYESGSMIEGCAGGSYGNDRYVTPDSDMTVGVVCWESCDACPEVVEGCTDDEALNFDENATSDDGSCFYEWPAADNLFFSEYAEGSSNHKYLEIYNATDGDVDLSWYSLSSCSNGCDEEGLWDYPDNVTFDATVASGDVYVVCHGSADDAIQAECDQTFTYLSNGDDVFALTQIGTGLVLDIIGVVGDDPGSGWDAAGVSNATKDHTLVRKASVTSGNALWLDNVDPDTGEVLGTGSAGSDAASSEWLVFDQNTWTYVGSHPHVVGCMDSGATNYDADAVIQSYNEFGTSTCTYASCEDIPTAMGCLWSDGTSSEWSDGWWDCTDNGGQVCGLHEVIFELDLPSDVTGTPHVRGTFNNWCDDCFNSMSDNGDGVWTFVQYFGADETHQYKFTIGSGWDVAEDVPDECAVEGTDNRGFATGGGNTSQTLASCYGTCDETCEEEESCVAGDVNGDTIVNVNDVVIVVAGILASESGNPCADMQPDGNVDVMDVVVMVSIILGDRFVNDATNATIDINDGFVSLKSNGFIGAVQMTLSHNLDFSIELTDKAMISDYRTDGNYTRLMIVSPTSDDLFEVNGDFSIEEIIVANSNSLLDVGMPSELTLSKAYPNPFNPSTSLNVYIPSDGFVSVNVYNVMGQLVDVLQNGNMHAGTHSIIWNASNMMSGIYFVRAESSGYVSTQKVMLMK